MTPRNDNDQTPPEPTDAERAAAEQLAADEAKAAAEAEAAAKAEADRVAAIDAEQQRANDEAAAQAAAAAAAQAAAAGAPTEPVDEGDTSGRPPLNELAEARAAERDRIEQMMAAPTPSPAA